MVKTTFKNLPKEKRDRFLEAAKNEFSHADYNNASINKIIKEAGISRGSFYTYFDTKADLVRCLLHEYAKAMAAHLEYVIEKNNGDIFEVFVALFDLTVAYTEESNDVALFHSLFKTIRTSSDFEDSPLVFSEEEKNQHINKIMGKINRENLLLKDDKEMLELFEMLFMITKQSLSKSMSNYCTKEEAKKSFLYKLDVLKYGIYDTNTKIPKKENN